MFNKINKLLVVISLVNFISCYSIKLCNKWRFKFKWDWIRIYFKLQSRTLEATYYYDYYFDASAESDGDGTINNPYKTLTANRIRSNSNIHLANGEYTLDKKKDISNVNFIGSDPEKTIIKFNGYGFNI